MISDFLMPKFLWLNSKMGCVHSSDGDANFNNGENSFKGERSPPPIQRGYTAPVHYPAEKEGDSEHVVALTSTTYGILKMDPVNVPEESRRLSFSASKRTVTSSSERKISVNSYPFPSGLDSLRKSYEKAGRRGLTEFKRLSSSRSSISEEIFETINTWELMEGLEDSPLMLAKVTARRSPQSDRSYEKSFAFHSVKDVEQLVKNERNASVWHKVTPGVKVEKNYLTIRSSREKRAEPSSPEESFGKPAWMLETPSPIVFDPDCISEFRKALEELSPQVSVGDGVAASTSGEDDNGGLDLVESGRGRTTCRVQAKVNVFQQLIEENSGKSSSSTKRVSTSSAKSIDSKIQVPPGGENKVVLYVTSLRGIRKTFEDCNTVKLILQASRIRVDERDISMHSEFKNEFQELFENRMTVPRLFVRGKYIGGVEEIQQLNETGELVNQFEGIPRHASFNVCEGCADVRFIPCNNCDGSCKIFSEDCRWLRCSECNENGLVRCPFCC